MTKRRKYEFNADLGMKRLFVNMDRVRIIEIVNHILKKRYSIDSKISFESNEQYNLTGKKKKKVIPDLVLKIEEPEKENSVAVIVEFQSRTDDEMGDRMFMYTLNKSELIDGVRTSVKGMIIYMVLDKPAKGYDEAKLTIDEASVGGVEYEDEKELRIKFRYVNILAKEFFGKERITARYI